MVCISCGGGGCIINPARGVQSTVADVTITCPACNGTGKVMVTEKNREGDTYKVCLRCGKEIISGYYCDEHRYGRNEYLPKPNDGEVVMKP